MVPANEQSSTDGRGMCDGLSLHCKVGKSKSKLVKEVRDNSGEHIAQLITLTQFQVLQPHQRRCEPYIVYFPTRRQV